MEGGAASNAAPPPRPPPRRYAEQASRRRSSCALADAVARCALARWEALRGLSAGERAEDVAPRGQTVVAGFVLHADGVLRAVAIGEGTKFLSDAAKRAATAAGEAVRDCHAEVLARRALLRWLRAQLVLVRAGDTACALEQCVSDDGDASPPLYQLRAGAHLHMYISAAPCGNACVRQWAKGAKETFREDLGAFGWPVEAHPKLFLSAAKDGQVAMLAKRDGTAAAALAATTAPNAGAPADGNHEACASAAAVASQQDFGPAVPPGCAPLGVGLGSTLTCSDKLMIWCALGLQGAALSAELEPVRPASVTVGRKFHAAALRRALCCRGKGFARRHRGVGADAVAKFEPPGCPALMCTSVVQDAGDLPDEGACFDSVGALAWAEGDSCAEHIDGRSGLSLSASGKPAAVSRRALYGGGELTRRAAREHPRARTYLAAREALLASPGLRWSPSF